MSSFLVVDKKTLSEVTVEGSTIILGDIATIHTHLKRSDVAEFVQDGNNLILKLKSGKVIVIKNYFTDDEDEHSDLLFEDGEVLGWLPFLLGGGAAGGIALAAGGSDGDGEKSGSGSEGGNTGNEGNTQPGDSNKPGAGNGNVGDDNNRPILANVKVTVKQGIKGLEVYDVNDATTGKDEDVDGDKLTYAITGGNENGLFVIDPNTGVIKLADGKELDYDLAPQHTLEVTATDGSKDQLSTTSTIIVNVSKGSSIAIEITPKGEITGTTDNVEKGPVTLKITGTDKDGNPVTIERDVELDRPGGSSKGKYTYQLKPEDGIVDGSKVTVEAKTVDRQGDTIHANTELPGYSGEDKTPGLDIVEPTIEITTSAGDHKVTWSEGREGDLSSSSKQGFTIDGTTTGVEAGQKVTVTFETADGTPITVEAIVDEAGKWSANITPDIAASLKDGSATVTVSDRAGNSTDPKTVDYTVDAPSANITGYYDNIENVLNTVEIAGEVSKTVTISSEIDPNLASKTTKTMVGKTITGDHGTFTLDASGKWTYTLDSDEKVSDALKASKGPLTEIFTVKDSGNKSYEVKVSINDSVKDDGENVVVSATASSLKDPSNVENIGSDQGKFTTYTNDSLGEIKGTASQGVEKVRVYINKQAAGKDEDMDSLGYPQYFEVAVKDGKWSLSEQDLTDGLQKTWWADQLRNDNIYLQVRAVDPTTGKVGEVSEEYTFVVDTVAPEATYVNYADGKVTALVSSNPKDKHHAKTGDAVMVKYIDQAGDVKIATGKVGEPAVADKPYLSISVDVKDLDPTKEFKVYVKDNAGNIGVNNDIDIDPTTVTLPIPEIDQYLDHKNNPDGKVQVIVNGGHSDDPEGQISGTVVLNEYQKSMVDEVRIFIYDNPNQFIKIPADQLVPVEGKQDTYRWTTKPGDLSTVTTTGKLAEGEVTLYAATYNKESGSLSKLSPPFKVTIDVTAPEITIESVAEDGIVSQSEKENGFSIKGSATGVEEGNIVTVDFNGETYEGTVTNVKNGHGSWEIKIPSRDASTLEDGETEEATAKVTDNAGNTSDPSSKSAKIHLTVLASTELIEIDEDSGPVTGQVTKTGYSLYHELASEIPPEIGVVEFDSYAYSGQFTFTPAKDWSGTFEFDILVRDGYGNENIVKQIIKVNPVADAPVLKTEVNFDVGKLSLNKYVWKEVGFTKDRWGRLKQDREYKIGDKTYDFHNTVGDDGKDRGHGSGINETTLVDGINALLAHKKPDSHALTNDMKSEGWIDNERPGEGLATGDVVFINGLVYLEAGKAYKYEGKADDTAMIKIGDGVSSKYVSWQGLGNQGLAEDLFTVEESGFYTFDLYIYNQDGIGNYNFKVTEADGTDVKYFPNIEAAQKEVSGLVHIDGTLQGSGGKGFYGVKFGYTGSETDNVDLEGVAASLTDRDGSETLSMTLMGLVEGTKLFYTAVDMDGKEALKSAIADAEGKITVDGVHNILDFKNLSLDLPAGIATGKLNVELTVTATETGNKDSKSTTTTFDVNVVKPMAAEKIMLDESNEGDTGELLSAADALQAETPVAFNAALGISVPKAAMDTPKWTSELAEGLLSDTDGGAYINVDVDEASETVTFSTDQTSDEVGSIDATMLFVADTHDPISFEDLLNHDSTSII